MRAPRSGPNSAFALASRRKRALRATAELWGEVGYEGLSAEAICAQAGIGAEAFAAEFPNVEGAAQASLEIAFAAVVRLVGAEFAPDRSEPESCALGIVAILEFMAANPAYAYVLYIGRRHRVSPELKETSRAAQRFIAAMLDRLRESSNSDGQPRPTALGALGGPEAVIRREILAGRTTQLRSLAPALIYGGLVPFVGQEEALRLARSCGGGSPAAP
jgi:AcrR family transcriptional regulator